MFPSQTSLIPVTVAITRYAAEHGFAGNYPFWYLGTTPIKYLTGPVVPSVLVGLEKLFGGNYFSWSIFLVFASGLIWAAGWFVFAKFLSGSGKLGLLVAVLVLMFPLDLVLSLGLGETSAILAASYTPWILFLFARYTSFVPGALGFAFLLLTSTVSAVPAILGLVMLAVIDKKWERGLKRAFLVLVLGWLLTYWWYSPGYWLTLLGAPSIGGRSVLGASNALFGFIKGLAPIFLAVLVVSFGFAKRTKFEKFAIIWLFTFGVFTLFRMFSDLDFWMDWTAWVGELEVGLALILAAKLAKISSSKHQITNNIQNSKLKILNFRFLLFRNWKLFGIWNLLFVILLLGWVFAFEKRDFWLPRKSIENSVEYKIAKELEKVAGPNHLVFLSGTSTFWLNSLVDVKQVRGGVDQASVDKRWRERQTPQPRLTWREAAWELREGADIESSERVVKELGIDYVVVHTENSSEFYHDFKNVEKFKDIAWELIYEENGDLIYGVK